MALNLKKKTKLLKNRTNISHEEKLSIITFYTDPKICQLNCLYCLNKMFDNQFQGFFTLEDLIDLILLSKRLGTHIVRFSGGEFLLALDEELSQDVLTLKKLCNIDLAVETNGQSVGAIEGFKELIKEIKYFFLDIKSSPAIDPEKTRTILGIENIKTYFNNLEETIKLLKLENKTIFARTPKYPVLEEKEFEKIKKYAQALGLKNWHLNRDFFIPSLETTSKSSYNQVQYPIHFYIQDD